MHSDFSNDVGVSGSQLEFEFKDGYEKMHKAWSRLEEVPFCFQGHSRNFKVTRDKTLPFNFNADWEFPDCNSIWNSQMATELYTKLEVA